MNESALDTYISKLKHSFDEDAFHSLVEAGEEAIDPVLLAITTQCSVSQFKRLVEVLQEIRTEGALAGLRRLCLLEYSEKWEAAAEGLFYNNPTAATRILNELLEQASPSDREAKSRLVVELIAAQGNQGLAFVCCEQDEREYVPKPSGGGEDGTVEMWTDHAEPFQV